MDFLNKIEKVIIYFEEVVMLVTGCVLLVSVALQVLFRYFIHISVPWTEESAVIAFIVMVFYAATLASYHNRLLGITNVVERLRDRTFIAVWFIKKIALFLFFIIVMILYTIPLVIEALNQTYAIIKIPLFYVFLQIPIFGLLATFHIVMSLLRKDYLEELLTKNK